MQYGQDLFEWLQDIVLFPEFVQVFRLFTENIGHGLDGVTILEAFGEWMFRQFYSRLLLVIVQRGLKEHTQM